MQRLAARCIGYVLAAAVVFICGAAPADASTVFGPEIYTKVQGAGTPDVYDDSLTVAASGLYAFWVQNGDDGGDRVTSGSVTVGTATIVGDAQLQGPRELFSRVLYLKAGIYPLTVALNQPEPGVFLSLTVIPATEKFDFAVGRLLLPYADSVDSSLALKNGSHRHDRRVRIHYYDGNGVLQATSDRLTLGPKANATGTAASFMVNGAWLAGSLEIFWAGRGGARVFGTATTVDPNSTVKGLVQLEHAGYRHRNFYRALNQ